MNSRSMPDKPQTGGRPRLRARRLALLALMAAGMNAAKAVMAPLPNIEPVTLLVMLCALAFGPQAFYAVYTFVALEFLLYGFGMWSFAYLYVWTIPAVGAMLLRRCRSRWPFALLSAAFGLLFGALCAIPYLFVGGWAAAVSFWTAGIVFDLIHAAGNFILAALLLPPLRRLLERLQKTDCGSTAHAIRKETEDQ